MESHNSRFNDPSAPVKNKKKVETSSEQPKAKKRLFLNKRELEAKSRILEFFDDFLINLSSAGFLDIFFTFVTLVAQRLFPLDKIAWKLFLDVVRFYGVDNVS